MPSKSKKQLDLFKLIKGYTDNGPNGFIDVWNELFPGRNLPGKKIMDKVIKISKSINYADLEDMSSGIEGDSVLGEKRDFKVGYWMMFESDFSDYQGKKLSNTFIAKINKIIPAEKIAKFNHNDIYNKFGSKTEPKRKLNISNADEVWLDYAYFDKIKKTAKTKEELLSMNEIRLIVRKVLSENFENTDELKINKRNSEDKVKVKIGMQVEKKDKDDDSVGIIKSVGVNKDKIPNTNNINVEWIKGESKGVAQTLEPEDIQALDYNI